MLRKVRLLLTRRELATVLANTALLEEYERLPVDAMSIEISIVDSSGAVVCRLEDDGLQRLAVEFESNMEIA